MSNNKLWMQTESVSNQFCKLFAAATTSSESLTVWKQKNICLKKSKNE